MSKAFILLLILLSSRTWSEDFNTRILIDKTFTRENTICRIEDNRIEIEVRSFHQYSESKNDNYGESAFLVNQNKRSLLPINSLNLYRYRFMKGESEYCNRAFAVKLSTYHYGILFLRDNRPFKDKLSVLIYDQKSKEALQVLDTEYSTDTAIKLSSGFAFPYKKEDLEIKMNHIQIDGTVYLYQERQFHYWIKFQDNKFEIDPEITRENFKFQKYFKDQEQFLKEAGWNTQKKEFEQASFFIAVNHSKKKSCITFQKDLSRPENWLCRDEIQK